MVILFLGVAIFCLVKGAKVAFAVCFLDAMAIWAYGFWKEKPIRKQDRIVYYSYVEKERPKEKPTNIYFQGCEDMAQLQSRYHNLCKAFHPDVASGDRASFEQMQKEYEKMSHAMKAG